MPLNCAYASAQKHVPTWTADLSEILAASKYRLAVHDDGGAGLEINTDWSAVASVMRHLVRGITLQKAGGRIDLHIRPASNGSGIELALAETDSKGVACAPVSIFDTFDHQDDTSATKYGGTGIELALADKFTQLLGGTIVAGDVMSLPGQVAGRRPATVLHISDFREPQTELLAA